MAASFWALSSANFSFYRTLDDHKHKQPKVREAGKQLLSASIFSIFALGASSLGLYINEKYGSIDASATREGRNFEQLNWKVPYFLEMFFVIVVVFFAYRGLRWTLEALMSQEK